MLRSVIFNMKAPYGAVDAWLYDAVVAPAVAHLKSNLVAQLVGELPRGGRVLDVGCGGGQLVTRISTQRSDVRVVGLDLNRGQLARGARRVAGGGVRAAFVRGSAMDLPFRDESFDAVVSVASIKHWPEPPRGLSECRRLLRPGGTLVVVEVDRGCKFEDARSFVARWRLPSPLQGPALMYFRTFVAGQGLDLDEARALIEPLALTDVQVDRLPATPALLLTGRAAAG